jgi:hypothetical protein
MPGEYIMLDKDEWQEIPNRHIHKSGNVYAGKEYTVGYEVRMYIRKIKEQ